jgi:hypothetical protein
LLSWTSYRPVVGWWWADPVVALEVVVFLVVGARDSVVPGSREILSPILSDR